MVLSNVIVDVTIPCRSFSQEKLVCQVSEKGFLCGSSYEVLTLRMGKESFSHSILCIIYLKRRISPNICYYSRLS